MSHNGAVSMPCWRELTTVAVLLAAAWLSGCREAAETELAITSNEYGFQMPDSVPAGLVHITLRNAGRDLHEAALVHFTDTIGTAAAYADSVRAHVEFPSNAEDVGGAALTMPGQSNGVWVRLTPGRYAVVCWKGDHMRRGMVHDFKVVAANGASRQPPRATRELSLVDFAFTFDKPLTAGRHVLHVRNVGKEDHEGDMFKATPTIGQREYVAWIEAGEHGLPPLAPVAAFGAIYPGKEAWVEMQLTPGKYFIICRVDAKADGRPHSQHGMVTEFTVE